MIEIMRVSFLVAALVCTPALLLAHTAGVSFEQQVGEYIVDIAYDPAEPIAGDRLLLDFTLSDLERPVDFDRVWVRIESSEEALLATGVGKATFGPTTLLMQIPSDLSGEITFSARFERDEEPLAEAMFSLPVKKRTQTDMTTALYLVAFFGGLAVGSVVGFMWGKERVSGRRV